MLVSNSQSARDRVCFQFPPDICLYSYNCYGEIVSIASFVVFGGLFAQGYRFLLVCRLLAFRQTRWQLLRIYRDLYSASKPYVFSIAYPHTEQQSLELFGSVCRLLFMCNITFTIINSVLPRRFISLSTFWPSIITAFSATS